MDIDTLQANDLKVNWHPCSQMKDYEAHKPYVIERAQGADVKLADGSWVIDAISSWWCKSLGHGHPRLKMRMLEQLDRFEHVIYANTTHDTIVQLSEKLATLSPGLSRVMYAGDGSCAVEMALKMSLHVRQLQGEPQRQRFIALANGYHGETAGAMSVSDLGLYKAPYESMLFATDSIEPVYVSGEHDPLWDDVSQRWPAIEQQLQAMAERATAVIVEPIIQGACGMKVISQDFLRRLAAWAKVEGIHVIADEIMTGIGRTGRMLASGYADMQPDFVCLSKGLTSGWMPFSAVLTSESIYQMFYGDEKEARAFLHSHTYSGNALGASLALETLNIIEQTQLCQRAKAMGDTMKSHMQDIAQRTGRLESLRGIGAMMAADVVDIQSRHEMDEICRRAMKAGALLRPLGSTVYWLPPLICNDETLSQLQSATEAALLG